MKSLLALFLLPILAGCGNQASASGDHTAPAATGGCECCGDKAAAKEGDACCADKKEGAAAKEGDACCSEKGAAKEGEPCCAEKAPKAAKNP